MTVRKKHPTMKQDKTHAIFSRLASGEVLGQIITEAGMVLQTKSFGIMTEDEYTNTCKIIERTYPDIAALKPIEITGN